MIELNKPYTVTVGFKPKLTLVGQFRALASIMGNHLFVVTAMNETGGKVLTMPTTAQAAANLALGNVLFQIGSGATKSLAYITKITPGSTLKG